MTLEEKPEDQEHVEGCKVRPQSTRDTEQVLSAASCFHIEEIFMFESLMDNILGRKIRSC